MVSPGLSHSEYSPMAKPRNRSLWCFSDGFLYCGFVFLAFLLVCSFWSFFTPTLNFGSSIINPSSNCKESGFGVNLKSDPKDPTFYDDPEMSYSIEKPVKDWDEKRREWLKHHPSFAAGASERIVLVTGSQPKPCKNPMGDHLLLRFFKNKVDYCRIHGYDIFYNNLLLHPKMGSYWAKLPIVKAAMLAHPEAEWIWWVDSDALFTDMEFKLPLERYKNHNLMVHGWPKLIYNSKSWTSLNAGVFLIRNCQWSMDLINTWSNMGPMGKEYKKWGQVQRSTFKDKLFPESDDQSALIYLLYKEKDNITIIYLEGEFYFEGYWVEIIGGYENTTERYLEIERGVPQLRRRHGEKVSEQYGAFREGFLKEAGNGRGSWRRPFITHFTGCQPCSGDHNQMYAGESCWNGMVKALNFADNQVLRKYGFIHQDLQDSSTVTEVPFDYPADEGPW
ncbi:putative glycosyltransferase 7 [Hibiscus syriacus]|uniref:Glycosyltransferase 7 n=1 Tax=Hibiscus syriacus TaxID=106335 RepID=A0A6A2ZMX4_HIBSY|nr:putative glycosyltransferase 7 [Hibiscus syriacus]KAE8693364.1 putative glycosyltransferase 7 [Hibiscus syriacus]